MTKKIDKKMSHKKISWYQAAVLLCSLLLAMPIQAALQSMSNEELEATAGQGLLVADKVAGAAGTNMAFYSMILNGQLAMNMNIDKLQLGCGGFNEIVVSSACDIDIDYVSMLGRTPSGTGGPQAATNPGAGDPATSQFVLNRPYLQFAIKNDDNPAKRSVAGFKIGSVSADGYMGFGRYITPGSAGAPAGCNSNAKGSGPFLCHMGINRFSGFMNVALQGDAYGCFGAFGCTAPQTGGDRVATFGKPDPVMVTAYGTRFNRLRMAMDTTTDPNTTLGLSLTVAADVSASLKPMKGMVVKSDDAAFLRDDFFLSFQRESVLWPTTNKTQAYSAATNPGWWFNFPQVNLYGLKAYGISASLGSLGGLDLVDPDFYQRAVDNCLGTSKFC